MIFLRRVVFFEEGGFAMSRMIGLILAAALAIAPLAGCDSGNVGSGTNYFPLTPNSTWTYQIFAKSQGTQYQVTDRVIGVKYVPALKLTGSIVDESYSLERGGTRRGVCYLIAHGQAEPYNRRRFAAGS